MLIESDRLLSEVVFDWLSIRRRKLTPDFKAKVVIETLREQSTMADIAKKYEITQAQLSRWKKEFLANAAAAFGGSEQQQEMKKLESERDSCHRKIGELEMKLDFAKRTYHY